MQRMRLQTSIRVGSCALLVLSLLMCLMSCGGGTSGSGGITVDGRLLTQSDAPVAGVTVTDLASGDADITLPDGSFGLLAQRASDIELLFEGQGLQTSARLTDIPADASRIVATFRAQPEQNMVDTDDVDIERKPNSSSSSNSHSSSSTSSAASTSGESSESSSDGSASSSSTSDDDESASSSEDDDGESESSASSSSASSGGSSSPDGGEINRTGPIESISPSLVRVGGINFIPQPDTEYEDEEGNDANLSDFAVGQQVEARGHSANGQVLLERLRRED